MKLVHTAAKKANRAFNKFYTGFANSSTIKAYNKFTFTKESEVKDKRFTKPKPIRKRRVLTHIKNK